MASSVTHFYFSLDVYEKLNPSVKSLIKNDLGLYKIFSQGPDVFNFYDLHLSRRAKKIYIIGKDMHHSNINNHFLYLVNYINDNDLYSNSEVLAYLYGQVCHFALDTVIHPFVIYNCGEYDNKDKNTYKYNGMHAKMEYYIDTYMIYIRENILPWNYKMYKTLFEIKSFSSPLNNMIDSSLKDVYGFDKGSNIYYKCIKKMKLFYRIFNYDKTGIKKLLYKLFDLIFSCKFIKKEELSFHVKPNSMNYFLNNEKESWNSPTDINEIYNYSFTELYAIAIKKAVLIINSLDDMLKNKDIKKDKICELFGDKDYSTGKDFKLNLKNKYFRY